MLGGGGVEGEGLRSPQLYGFEGDLPLSSLACRSWPFNLKRKGFFMNFHIEHVHCGIIPQLISKIASD